MPDISVPVPVWVWILRVSGFMLAATGLAVWVVFWKTGKLPFQGITARPTEKTIAERRQDAGVLMQVVKENTAAMVSLRALQEDSKSITLSAVEKLDAMGKVLAAMTVKLQDMHDDVRPQQKRHAVGGG